MRAAPMWGAAAAGSAVLLAALFLHDGDEGVAEGPDLRDGAPVSRAAPDARPDRAVPGQEEETAIGPRSGAQEPREAEARSGDREARPGVELAGKSVDELVRLLLDMRRSTSGWSADLAHLVCDELLLRVSSGGDAVADLFEALVRCPDPAVAELLSEPLGAVPDPRIREGALRMAREDREPWRRLLALDLLDRVGATRETLPGLAALIHGDPDPAVVQAAISSLDFDPAADEPTRAAVLYALGEAARSPQEETRRRAVLALGTWARGEDGARTLADRLERDPSASVRRAAAQALAEHRSAPIVLHRLAAVVARAEEDEAVREAAWEALGKIGDLDPETRAVYLEYETGRR